MHIPDGYLSPATAGSLYLLSSPFWYAASRKTKAMLSSRLIPLMALMSAFCFVIQMLNIPLPGGTTGHAAGASLAAIVLTPWPAILAVSVAIIIQALFFGDGGITAIGANCFNMAIVQVFVASFIYKLFESSEPRTKPFVAAIAGYVSLNVSGLITGIELGIQPLIAQDASGTPMYAPYPLNVALTAMITGHLLAGFAEAAVSGGAIAFLQRSAPELLNLTAPADDPLPRFWSRMRTAWLVLTILVFLTPLGLLAPGTAWGEWSSEQLRDLGFGFIPTGMQRWEGFWEAIFPDYSIPGMGEKAGYVLSAAIGAAMIGGGFLLLTYLGKRIASKQ